MTTVVESSETERQTTLDDPRLTSAGLLFEAADGLRDLIAAALEPTGVARSEMDVLIRLARSPGHRLRMADLAAQVAMSASGLTRLVDRMGRSGLVRREACPDDGRGAFAVATDEGISRIETGLGALVAVIEGSFTGLFDEAELAPLLTGLRRVRDVVRPAAAAGGNDDPPADTP